MIHQALSRSIIGIAMEVLNELSPGLDEKRYERAMAIKLRRCAIPAPCKAPFRYSTVIVNGKVVSAFTESQAAQTIGYLNIKGLKLAPLLNFKNVSLTWKRVVNERVHENGIRGDLRFPYLRNPRNPRSKCPT